MWVIDGCFMFRLFWVHGYDVFVCDVTKVGDKVHASYLNSGFMGSDTSGNQCGLCIEPRWTSGLSLKRETFASYLVNIIRQLMFHWLKYLKYARVFMQDFQWELAEIDKSIVGLNFIQLCLLSCYSIPLCLGPDILLNHILSCLWDKVCHSISHPNTVEAGFW